jgi:N-methylhydantoinase A
MACLDELDFQKVNELLGQMEEEGVRLLSSAGVPEAEIALQRSCDMRYLGQGHEIQVPIPSERLGPEHLGEVSEAFDSAYRRLYHRTNEGYTVECLNWRVVASGPKPRLNLKVFPASPDASLENAVKRVREVYFPEYGDFRPCTTYDRYSLDR